MVKRFILHEIVASKSSDIKNGLNLLLHIYSRWTPCHSRKFGPLLVAHYKQTDNSISVKLSSKNQPISTNVIHANLCLNLERILLPPASITSTRLQQSCPVHKRLFCAENVLKIAHKVQLPRLDHKLDNGLARPTGGLVGPIAPNIDGQCGWGVLGVA